MRPAVVRLIDLGFDRDFDTSMSFAQSLIQSLITRDGDSPVAEVEFIRTRDLLTVSSALRSPATVIHIMAHGDNSPDEVGFWSDDDKTSLNLSGLAEEFGRNGEGIEAPIVFADCCKSAQGRFVRAIRDCIERPVVYIGAKRSVSWHEATTFASAFYGAFFRDQGSELRHKLAERKPATRAIAGYQKLVAGPCPFVVKTLEPSRKAQRLLGA